MGLVERMRTTHLDAGLAVVFTVAGLVQVVVAPIAHVAVGALFVVGSTVPLAWRRTFPVEAALVAAAFWVIPLDGFPYAGFVVVILQFFSLGQLGEPGRAVILTALAACIAAAAGTLLGPEEPIAVVTAVLMVAAPVVAGRIVRREQRQKQALVGLAQELAAERRRGEEAAIGAERARIAQELHDVVGHEVTLMAIQAEAAAAALAVAPERAVAPIDAIRSTAHRTLREMRGVLGVLAPAGQSASPSDEGIDDIVRRAREAGIACDVTIVGAPTPEQTSVSLAVNRIVRECLTNAARHGVGQPVRLDVRWCPDGVHASCVNDTHGLLSAAPGRGLIGMRHRAELLGGTFEAVAVDGRFEVQVSIPTRPTS
ncbi:MAG: sensor histidine kinase [Ilumatobacteraceae bacterium]